MTTKTQLRGICPICFREHATKAGWMVQHGYQRPERWHQNVGECTGTGRHHFGSPAGLQHSQRETDRLSNLLALYRVRRLDIIGNRVEMLVRETRVRREGRFVTESTEVRKGEAGWDQLVRQHLWVVESDIRSLESTIRARLEREAKWVETPLREVTVEKRAPLVHFYTGGNRLVFCAGSVMAGHRLANNATRERERVTCPKCLARLQNVK